MKNNVILNYNYADSTVFQFCLDSKKISKGLTMIKSRRICGEWIDFLIGFLFGESYSRNQQK